MATEGRRAGTPLIEELYASAFRFDFFQAVRVLERHAERQARRNARANAPTVSQAPKEDRSGRRPVGFDADPDREIVRFRALPALSFPAGPVAEVVPPEDVGETEDETAPTEMLVTFLGLTGPQGVLPRHYTALLLKRLQQKDSTLRAFFDLFHHRTISLFYRAWEKYRFPFALERHRLAPSRDTGDLFTDVLYCLVGMGTAELAGRTTIPDESLLYYAGHFADRHRPALTLETILADYFELPITIEQFEGQWLYLDDGDCSRLPGRSDRGTANTTLGLNLVAGRRIWDVQSKFRVRVGPVKLTEFKRLMPIGDMLRPLTQMARLYVGPDFDFDIQPVLEGPEVPWFQLDSRSEDGPRLGWTTWSRVGAFERDVDDVSFSLDASQPKE